MDRMRNKREPLREAPQLQNTDNLSGVNIKDEPAERSALAITPEYRNSPTPVATNPHREQVLQADTQRRREELRERWLLESQIHQETQRGEQLSHEELEISRQMDSQRQGPSQAHSLPTAIKQERIAATPTRQTVKTETSSSQAADAPPTPATTSRRSCLACQSSHVRGSCATCRRVYYCSIDCQTRDWRRHYAYCSEHIPDPGPPGAHQPVTTSATPGHTTPNSSAAYGIHGQHSASIISSNSGSNDGDHTDSDADSEYGSIYGNGEQDPMGLRVRDDIDEVRKLIELFANLPDIDVPPEDRKRAPNALACSLMPHQRVGLTWLIGQEESFRRGSILADHMGLGKTIQALALILARPSKESANKITLIVAPLALLKQWEREIEDKIKPGYKLKTIIVHGPKKKTLTVARLSSYDVVLTTYGTIAAEYKPRKNSSTRTLLLKIRYHRIILDEAHKIKNDRSQAARAVSSLRAMYRLCMTGTPLMNNTGELYSLINFLRIPPYNDWTSFRENFVTPMKKDSAGYGRAMKALQAVVRTMLLQRTATSQIDGVQILDLPKLTSETVNAEFNDEQRGFYKSVEHKMQLKFNKYLRAGTVLKNYSYILVLILRLRQCCCHPFLITNHGIPEGTPLKPEEMIRLALKLDDLVIEQIKTQTEFECPMCDQVTENPIIVHPCGHHICGECFTGLMIVRDGQRDDCDDEEVPFVDCPWDGCDKVVDPRKVLCHCFFVEAHMAEDSEDFEVQDEDLDEEEDISDDTDADADDDGNLKGFIVSDDDECLQESTEQSNYDDDLEDSNPRPQFRRHHMAASENDSKSELDETNDGLSKIVDAGNGKQNSSRTDEESGAGSDLDELPELGYIWQRADKLKQPIGSASRSRKSGPLVRQPAQKGLNGSLGKSPKTEDTFGSNQRLEDPKLKRPRLEDNDDTADEHRSKKRRVSRTRQPSSPVDNNRKEEDSNDNDADSKKQKKDKGKGIARPRGPEDQASKDRKRKTKRKTKVFTSLSHLKAESNKNATAKARYLKRLRKEYESSAKIDRTMELLQEIGDKNRNEKTLIFSVFTSFLDILEIPIQDAGYIYRRYDGSMRHVDREQAVDDFMKVPEVKIMLVSLQAGNAGLNLQAATQVIILDPFWNPSVEEQAVGRAHRLGQKNPVTVHKMLVDDTIEDRILELQDKKRELVGEVLNGEAARRLSRLSIGELTRLFGLGPKGRPQRE